MVAYFIWHLRMSKPPQNHFVLCIALNTVAWWHIYLASSGEKEKEKKAGLWGVAKEGYATHKC